MDNQLNSLPAALAAEIQQLASQMHSPDHNQGSAPTHQPSTPSIQQAMLELARNSPELFASMLLASLGVSGIEVVETHTKSEDRRVDMQNGAYRYTDVVAFETTNTIRRQAHLVRTPRERR